MPGSTPLYALPYPLGTDPISDGDDQIKALAERVEALMPAAWTTLTLISAIGLSGFRAPQYRVSAAGNVELRGVVQCNTATMAPGFIFATVPAGNAPGASELNPAVGVAGLARIDVVSAAGTPPAPVTNLTWFGWITPASANMTNGQWVSLNGISWSTK